MQFHFVTSSIMHTANIEIEQYVRESLTKDFKKRGNHSKPSAPKRDAVAYRNWSFSRGSNCYALTRKVLVF